MFKRLRLSESEKWAAFLALAEKIEADKAPEDTDIQAANKLAVVLDRFRHTNPILTKWIKRWRPAYGALRLRLTEDDKWAVFLALAKKADIDRIGAQTAAKLAINLTQSGYTGPILTKWAKEWKPTYRMQAQRAKHQSLL